MDMDIETVSGLLGVFFLAAAFYRKVRAHRHPKERFAKTKRGRVCLRDPYCATDEENEIEVPGGKGAVVAEDSKTYVWR